MAERGTLSPGRMGAQVHSDLSDLHLLLVRTYQDPQWRMEHYQLAGEFDPDVGNRSAAARARSVFVAVSGATAPHAVAVLYSWVGGRGGSMAPRPSSARRSRVLDGISRLHVWD